MLGVRLALIKTFIDAFAMSDAYDRLDDIHVQFMSIIEELDDVEAAEMPAALADVLRAIESDLLRWRALGDLAVALDMFELLPALLNALERQPDVHQLANAASLSTNPAASPSQRELVGLMVDKFDGPVATKRMLKIRLGQVEPESDLERALDAQVWAGKYARVLTPSRPTVYLIESDVSPQDVWRAAAVLSSAGARIKRFTLAQVSGDLAKWVAHYSPVVHWSGSGLARWRTATAAARTPAAVLVNGQLNTPLERARLVSRVRATLGSRQHLMPVRDQISDLPPAFSPETLQAGAYDFPEMSFLGATTRHSLHRLASEGLTPTTADVQRWSFSQLVAVRIVQGFRASGMRYQRNAGDLVRKLEEVATASAMQRVGLGADGDVFIDPGDGFRNERTGQQAFNDVLAVDEVFRPFKLGDGAVPDLLRPSRFTTVHPLTLGGTPCVEDKRISARVLAAAGTDGRSSVHILRSAYPELNGPQLSDAMAVGARILARTRS